MFENQPRIVDCSRTIVCPSLLYCFKVVIENQFGERLCGIKQHDHMVYLTIKLIISVNIGPSYLILHQMLV